ncbi:MAG: protein kinase, partial [Gemmatimonadaceae bacterium]
MPQTQRYSLDAGNSLDRYEVLERLAAGGMGEVYRARDPLLERDLVLKVLPQRGVFRADALERFVREARAASALNHPNIVTIYAVGEADDVHFIAMELVVGRTLKQVATDRPNLQRIAEIGTQAARALAVAHEAGIVHRDIKPENIMVRDDGYVKVLDFGIAQLTPKHGDEHERDTPLTLHGTIVGTARYMSPEQAAADELTSASDIFSLGIVLYEIATARHPFGGSSDVAVMGAIILQHPPPPSTYDPRLTRKFDSLISRMLLKDAVLRPTAVEVATMLAAIAAPEETGSTSVSAPGRGEIVGRELEKQTLRHEWSVAVGGRATMVCISGEPGIGKTTLVSDFLVELARASSHVVASGRCSERLAGAEAYLPILDALDNLMRSDITGTISSALASEAPSWRRQLAGDTGPTAEYPLPSQERLKRELAGFVDRVSERVPLILFIEDIHWADSATVDVLAYVITRLGLARLMIIVTYRPSELRLAQHPFLALRLDLQTRGIARDLPLNFLSLAEVEALMSLRFPQNVFPRELVRLIHDRTEGNPLFVTDLADDLRAREILRQIDGTWTLAGSLPDLERELPESVRSMVERKIAQLGEDDSGLLEAAAVQGYEFDSAVVAAALGIDPADAEDRLLDLERLYSFVNRLCEHEFPDGTVATRYRFVHVLYQNALYASLTVSRRVQLSRSVANTLLSLQRGSPGSIAAELGFLFESARDADKASEYFDIAARAAAKVFANLEAAVLARRGLALLSKLPEGPERHTRELSLQAVLGTSVGATQGYSAPDVLAAMARARLLAEELGDQPQLGPVLWSLFVYYIVSGDIPEARTMAIHYLRWASSVGEPSTLVGANLANGISLIYLGHVADARQHLTDAVKHYDRNNRAVYHAMYRMDLGVFLHSELARNLWVLGLPDSALESTQAALELGKGNPDPRSLAFSLLFAAVVHQLRREPEQVLEYTTKCIEVCDEHGVGQERVWAMAIHGWGLSHVGRCDEGIKLIETSIAIQKSRNAELNVTYALRQLAESLNLKGSYVAARDAAREGLQMCERHGEVASKAELYRIMGESARSLAKMGADDEATQTLSGSTVSPEACFRAAVELTRKQGANGFELRSSVALG